MFYCSSRSGAAVVYARLVFNSSSTIPSESSVLNATTTLLNSRLSNLNHSTNVLNISYQKTSINSYRISFGFKISNVSIYKDIQLQSGTYDVIQSTINGLLNTILNDPSAPPFVFQRANFTLNDTVIQADAEYVFVEGDIKTPSKFLTEILKVSGLGSGAFPGWALAIIIPCGIAIILVPCWILLCILLSGCCGAVRRRWRRRRSYNVQYTVSNGLF
ncbi:putative threonine-rich GPI-anchored glycoprotein isoform X1 [Astyanax mexicanus]|uniref:Putative threonine-rich GPI-anchored glycoprotein isoform X1 n=1 Tax=Astyanax mexicanus TaxID=7994 RepID=A0A8T2M2D7_ASTMX|nr:putative threonine-rich GPI-anchored glycoprotein isoform X1 [Astyanax mexicanus]